jgi:hypothetical protein
MQPITKFGTPSYRLFDRDAQVIDDVSLWASAQLLSIGRTATGASRAQEILLLSRTLTESLLTAGNCHENFIG